MNMEKSTEKVFSCEDCEMAIIAGTVESDPAAKEHLATCSACREFAEFQASVLNSEPVISGNIPDFARICSARKRQQQIRANCLKFVVLPTVAAAAAVCLAVGGVFFHMQGETAVGQGNLEYTIFADASAFEAVLEESSVTLAWDQVSSRETTTRKLVRDLREAADWNIEMFNPYNEDL